MPISFSTSLELDLVFSRWSGVVDVDAASINYDNYLHDANFKPGRPELVDLSGTQHLDFNFKEIRQLVRVVNVQSATTGTHTKTVIWAPRDQAYATCRMYQQVADYLDGIEVHLFREEKDALSACGVPSKTIQAMLDEHVFLPAELLRELRAPA